MSLANFLEPDTLVRSPIFTKSDFQAEHLRIIYKYYKDKIVDLFLKKKIRPKKIKLVQLKK